MVIKRKAALLLLLLQLAPVLPTPLREFYGVNLTRSGVIEDLLSNDDDSSVAISLAPSLPFYGSLYPECYINNNGIVYMAGHPTYYNDNPWPLPNITFAAPFYGDVDTQTQGRSRTWFTNPVTRDEKLLKRAQEEIIDVWPEFDSFVPEYLVIATWETVGYYRRRFDKLNTFQCVLTTDGNISFAMFLYDSIEWTHHEPHERNGPIAPARIGFNEGMNLSSWQLPCSGTQNNSVFSETSNVGRPGVWMFRVDREEIEPVCPNTLEKEGMCTVIDDSCEREENLCSTEDSCLTASLKFSCQPTNKTCEIPTDDSTDNDSSTPVGAIVGSVFGVMILVALLVVALLLLISWLYRKKKFYHDYYIH